MHPDEIKTTPATTMERLAYALARLKRWAADWQEALFQLPTLVVLVLGAAFLVPALSRQAGVPVAVEYLPEVGYALVAVFKLALAGFSAWLLKRLYMQNLSAEEETELQKELTFYPNGASKGAVIRLAADRIEWFACFAVCCWALF